MRRYLALSCLLFLACSPAVAGGKLPRFASLGSDEVNVRTGPGTRYPIRWIYHRRQMPIQIIDEYGNWRQIKDVDGETGWVHYGLLSGKRTALIKEPQQTMRRNPDSNSPAVLVAKHMVIARLLRCNRTWCYMEIGGYKGWMEKSGFFGTYEHEAF